jgi:hypothetical protein
MATSSTIAANSRVLAAFSASSPEPAAHHLVPQRLDD